ncbi:MAG: efflux RND transporter permease subunit [Verrucomicrobia bacterium]|nr:efflux RND transporter permease subunit [Verrucomicrobiota bacterium]
MNPGDSKSAGFGAKESAHSSVPGPGSGVGSFALRHRLAILFITIAVCLGGGYCALRMPSSVFPETEFPRCVILVDSGVMPADEMMATITRPIEEAMKDIPGVVQVRSATGRGQRGSQRVLQLAGGHGGQ